MTRACDLLAQGSSVRCVGKEIGYSSRRFIELMRRNVGVGPKLFARLARFQSTLATLDRDRS